MNNKNIKNNSFIEYELKNSYINYSMSVIINRSIPDIRDGLKPVHRRILYSMYKLNNYNNKQFKKSARIVGDVIGKYHPHGDSSVYDAIIKMVQKFSSRYPLIIGQGNFGSIDGDTAAAMRYTEIKMSKICHELFYDLDENIIKFEKNYDGNEILPKILPSRIPNLLINGTYGIAVGIATNIPPHNINEVIDGCIEVIKNPDISIQDLNKIIIAPDFPTSGIIINKNNNILDIYTNGYGNFIIKSKIKIKNNLIIIYEIPYQVNKLKLIESIVKLIKNKLINGISNITDESDKNGIKIIIETKENYLINDILKKLYKKTKLQINYNVNMIALYKNKPKKFNLKTLIKYFIKYRKYIIKNKILYLLNKNIEKIHIIEGIIIAIYNINNIINCITKSNSYEKLIENINSISYKVIINYKDINNDFIIKDLKLNKKYENFKFSNKQIKSILNLKINKLMSLEYKKLINKYNDINKINNKYKLILNNENKLNKYIINELLYIKNKHFNNRITKIYNYNNIKNNIKNINIYMNKNFIIILTINNYIKIQQIDEYKIQNRRCKGKLITKIFDNDYINKVCKTNIVDKLFLFSNKGKIYSCLVNDIIRSNKYNKGKIINNLISIPEDEKIVYIFSLDINENNINKNLLLCTKYGFIKKIKLILFNKIRSTGILCIKLKNDDEIINVKLLDKNLDIIIFTKNGKSLRFNENKIKNKNRNSCGIRGIKLSNNDKVVSLIYIKEGEKVLNITNKGYGKISDEKEYIVKNRFNKGINSIKISDKNGFLINACNLNNDDNIFIFTNLGYLLKINSNLITKTKRNTKGVLLIKLNINEKIIYLTK